MSDFEIINVVLLFMATLVALAVVHMRNLLAAAMLMSIYSFLMALIWTNMDSMDVAFTEAAVGAGISTVLFIAALAHVGTEEKTFKTVHWPGLLATGATALALLYGTVGMPRFGDVESPANSSEVHAGYIRQDVVKVAAVDDHGEEAAHAEEAGDHEEGDYFHGHAPNLVTAVIVSYRAFDTMFETAVIFVAGLSIILLLRVGKPEE